jgi:hypothetical protein
MIPSTLESMPYGVLENILSYLGPTYGVACASRTLYSAHTKIVGQMGIVLAAPIVQKNHGPEYFVTQEVGFATQKMATLKVRAIWAQITEQEKVLFKGYTIFQISASPLLYKKLVQTDLRTLVQLVRPFLLGAALNTVKDFLKVIPSIDMVVAGTINHVEYVPESIGFLTSLTCLCLDGMHFKRLPPSIGQLTALQGLYVRNNELETLPAEIENNKALVKLCLDHNQLKALPETMGGLVSLKFIDVRYNRISKIPESFNRLISLENAFFQHNLIQTSPYSLASLPSLKSLTLQDNPFKPEQKFIDLLNTKRADGFYPFYVLPPSGLNLLWHKLRELAKRVLGGPQQLT